MEFDLGSRLRENIAQPITKTVLVLRDKRTGKRTEHVIYHPGYTFPLYRYGAMIMEYGFEVVSCQAEDTVTGPLPWEQLYEDQKNKGDIA